MIGSTVCLVNAAETDNSPSATEYNSCAMARKFLAKQGQSLSTV